MSITVIIMFFVGVIVFMGVAKLCADELTSGLRNISRSIWGLTETVKIIAIEKLEIDPNKFLKTDQYRPD